MSIAFFLFLLIYSRHHTLIGVIGRLHKRALVAVILIERNTSLPFFNFLYSIKELAHERIEISSHFFLGVPAVSRYVRSRKFHLVDNQPNFPDHDFPKHGIRINPSAYVALSNQRKRSLSVDSYSSCELKPRRRSRSCDTQLFPDIKQRTLMVSQLFFIHSRWKTQ